MNVSRLVFILETSVVRDPIEAELDTLQKQQDRDLH